MQISIMNRILFIVCLFLVHSELSAQALQGKVLGDRGRWKPQVYLLRMDEFGQLFNGNFELLVDSAAIHEDGRFSFASLRPSSIYRLNMIPTDETEPTAIINDGVRDNYTFVLTDATPAPPQSVHFYADSVLMSAHFDKAGLRSKSFVRLWSHRAPAYRLLGHYGRRMDAAKDSIEFNRLRTEGMKAVFKMIEQSDTPLLAQLLTVRDPLVLAAGIEVYVGFEKPDKNKTLQTHAEKILPLSTAPYVRSLYTALKALRSDNVKRTGLSGVFPALNGPSFRIDTISARFVLLDFWASWCHPCRADLRNIIIPLRQEFSMDELQIIGVNLDEDTSRALAVMRADKNPYPQVYTGGPGRTALTGLFGIKQIPVYVIYDRQNGTFVQGLLAVQLADKLNRMKRFSQ
jgi:thiol-disulfide isomerase/thioredoxin